MKAKEIRSMSVEEMKQKLAEKKENLFTLRFQHGTGQLENSAKLKTTKKDIARILSIIHESELN